jgi:hypothetical protein
LTGIALSRLGIIPAEFYKLTPIEFDYALKDFVEIKRDEATFFRQTGYEIGRYISVHIWNSKGRRLRSMIKNERKDMPFPWEAEQYPFKKEKQTPEHMALVAKGIASALNKEFARNTKSVKPK